MFDFRLCLNKPTVCRFMFRVTDGELFMVLERRKATETDKQFLRQLFTRVYEEVVVRQIGHWDDQAYDKYFEDSWPGNNYELIESNGEILAAMWVEYEHDHIWLREIQVCPEHQNKGIGSRLLRQLMEDADASGLPIRLRVLRRSRALPLYEKVGFARDGEYKDSHFWMAYQPANK